MAFVIPKREIVLEFEGDYEAARVICRGSVPISTFLTFQNIDEDIEEGMRRFGDTVLLEWDLEDDDGPIPATGEGMLRLPPDLATAIFSNWSDQSSSQQGSAPESLNGSTSEEQPTLQAVQ
tara:strand:- start:3182 stop:3544 length:363 start_codon:yes stop_codon:yes gene_type:complete